MTQALAIPADVRLMGWAAHSLFALALLLSLGALALWVARHPAWALERIIVAGTVQHQSSAAVQTHLDSRLEGNFLTIDLQEVQRLFEELPWVRQAVVQREFPNRLRVTLQEHEAVAWWGRSGGKLMLNRHGEVFAAYATGLQTEHWSELTGPNERSHQVYALYQLLAPVFAGMGQRLDRLELNARGSWQAELDGGARIELGRGEAPAIVERAQQFAQTVPTLLLHYGQRDIEAADLRYPNGYALRLRGVTTLLPAPPTPLPASPAQPTQPAQR